MGAQLSQLYSASAFSMSGAASTAHERPASNGPTWLQLSAHLALYHKCCACEQSPSPQSVTDALPEQVTRSCTQMKQTTQVAGAATSTADFPLLTVRIAEALLLLLLRGGLATIAQSQRALWPCRQLEQTTQLNVLMQLLQAAHSEWPLTADNTGLCN